MDTRTAPSSTEFQRVTRERLGLSVRRTQFLEVRGEGRIVGQAVRGRAGAGAASGAAHMLFTGRVRPLPFIKGRRGRCKICADTKWLCSGFPPPRTVADRYPLLRGCCWIHTAIC